MTFVTEVKKTVTDTSPVYAVVGVTDLAVEKVRLAQAKAVAARAEFAEFDVTSLQDKAAARATKLAEQAQTLPTLTAETALKFADLAQESYEALVVRGEELVKRLREQKATADLFSQGKSTIALGKGAVTTAKNAAAETQRAGKATLTTAKHQAGKVVDTLTDIVSDDAETATAVVDSAVSSTKPAVKRTATTAKKRAAATKTATKSATTSARKTAAAAKKAAADAADKVGDAETA